MSALQKVSATEIVYESWSGIPPEWVVALAKYCDSKTQVDAGRKIGRSASLVNQVLKNRYTGDLSNVQSRAEAAFNIKKVACPILGEINGEDCLKHQTQPYNSGNHIAVSLFRACRKCPQNIQLRKDTSHVE